MPAKTAILETLGETTVLLPSLIAEALLANDRIKLRLTLLQMAAAGADRTVAAGIEAECRALQVTDPDPAALLADAQPLADGTLSAPGLGRLAASIRDDLATMRAPLRAADPADDATFSARAERLAARIGVSEGERITAAGIAALTGAAGSAGPGADGTGAEDTGADDTGAGETGAGETEGAGDSVHRLVMDIHKALNRLAAETAVETIDGAQVHALGDADRAAVRAFMRGVNRTAKLAFGHPGLATTAVAAGGRLTIQNDIGATDAHVVVVHVTAEQIAVTYSDIHRRRVDFFVSLFADRAVEWQPLSQKAAAGLERTAFYLLVGRVAAPDPAARDAFLEFLGARIVFLIDWNRARKALRLFAGRRAAAELLLWAARNDLGHRALLELGGAGLIFDIVSQVAEKRIAYGVRLDEAMGQAACRDFLRGVLRRTSEGLRAGRTARLIRDEIRADLARHFETAETSVLVALVRHLGLSRMLAASIADTIAAPALSTAASRAALAQRAKRMEAKADLLTLTARGFVPRLRSPNSMRAVIDEVEAAMDSLEDCAYAMALVPQDAIAAVSVAPVSRLSGIVTEAIGDMVRAAEAMIRLPDEEAVDAVASLQAIDEAIVAEQSADLAERETMAALLAATPEDARSLILGLRICAKLETATDHLAHAALSLRERVLADFAG